MNFNINSGYGAALAHALHGNVPLSGKLFVVGDSGTAHLDMIKEAFVPDSDGVVRFFSTIDAAINNCTANAGDVILVAPGHAETLSDATSLNADIAGVRIIGLGFGTDRPTITFDTATTATIPVSAANISFENFIFTANFADIVAPFTLTTAKNFKLKNCAIKATASAMNFLYVVDTNTTDNAADGLEVVSCTWIEPDTATVSFLKADADLDQFVFQSNYLNLGVNTSDLPAVATVATGKDLTNAMIGGMSKEQGNIIIRLNDANPLLITADTTTANTGFVANNFVRHLDVAAELLVTAGTNFGFFENKATAAVDASGYLLPAADS